MLKRATFFGTLAGLGFLLGAISGALASEMPTDTELRSKIVDHLDGEMGRWGDGGKNKVLRLSATVYEHTTESHSTESRQFPRIEQPLANKVAVTLGGLSLIGLELWWFLFSKPKSQKVEAHGEIQEVTVTVDGGYEPSRIVVQVGQPVRLNFLRRDKSRCLEEVRLPDFRIARNLPLNEVTTVEFTPTQPGSYEFACGMNMFRGVLEVQASYASSKERASTATSR